jgi:hypothetical protein
MKLRAGKPGLVYRGKVVAFVFHELRSDWDQLTTGMGFPFPGQKFFCWCCPCNKKDMHRQATETPFTHQSYMAEVNKCRLCLHVNYADAAALFAVLGLDRRVDNGMRGRILTRGMNVNDAITGEQMQLCKYDRLDLGGAVLDTHSQVDSLHGTPPYKLFFWRKSPENCLMALSCLFQIPGFRFENIMLGDLHALDLGVTPRIVGNILSRLLREGSTFSNKTTKEGITGEGCKALTATMKTYFRGKSRSRPLKISFKGLGLHLRRGQGHLKCKGAQAKAMLFFSHDLLTRERAGRIPGGVYLRRASAALVKAYELMASSQRCNLDCDRLQGLLEKVRAACRKANVPLIPKFHLVQHLGHVARRAGNPRFFSEYADESHNRKIVHLAQTACTRNFAAKVLAKERAECLDDLN